MKKLIITCAMLMTVSAMSFAQTAQKEANAPVTKEKQTRPTPEQMAERRAKMEQKQYGLSDEQYKGVYSVELDQMKQREEMRKNNTKPGEGTIMQMNMSRDQRFKTIMNADQYAKYEATKPKSAQSK